jgi:hypothetical protein
MTMGDGDMVMTESGVAPTDWPRVIVVGILGLIGVAAIVAGSILYFWIIADYIEAGAVPFAGFQLLGWIVGLISAGVMAVGLIILGVALRLIDWRNAPRASLVLAIVSVLLDMLTYGVFSNTGHGPNSVEIVLLQGACILALFLVPLPPFLHWLWAKPAVVDIGEVKP